MANEFSLNKKTLVRQESSLNVLRDDLSLNIEKLAAELCSLAEKLEERVDPRDL